MIYGYLIPLWKEEKIIITSDSKKGELEEYSVCLNSPWGQNDETWTIKYNCKDNYTETDENEPTYKCEYMVVGYECITSVLYGYGNTKQEALNDCEEKFKCLQETYNKDDESF